MTDTLVQESIDAQKAVDKAKLKHSKRSATVDPYKSALDIQRAQQKAADLVKACRSVIKLVSG